MAGAAQTFDRSKTTVASTSTELLPAVPSRLKWRAQAPQNADLWINPVGGIAGPNLAGCFKVSAGQMFGSSDGVMEPTAINYWCGTANLIISVVTYH